MKIFNVTDKKRCLISSGLMAFISSFIFTMGLYVSRMYSTSFYNDVFIDSQWEYVLFGLIHLMILYPMFYFVMKFLSKKYEENDVKAENKFSKKVFFVSAGIILSAYLFVLYACYPGFCSYDVGGEITPVLYEEVSFSGAHPLFHALIMGGLVKLGYTLKPESLKFGLFLYNFFQATVCACCFAYSVEFLYRISKKKILYIVSLLFYCFCPAILLLSLATTKDGMCCSCLLVGSILLYQLYNDSKTSLFKWVLCGVFFVLACLFRVNVVWIIVMFACCSLILVNENRRKQILLFASVVILSLGINRFLSFALQASSMSSIEFLSVPIQQLSRLYVEKGPDAFSEEELKLLYAVSETEGGTGLNSYSPFLSDSVKYAFKLNENDLKNHMGEFLRIWIKKGFQYPGVYFMAICANTYQAWYPGTFVYSAYGYNYFEKGLTDINYSMPKIERIYDWLVYMFGSNDECGYKDVFGLRVFASMGTYFCLMLFSVTLSFAKKDKKQMAILMLPAVACAMYMVGPLSSIRYYLILFDFAPVMFAFDFGCLRKRKGSS